ncbi:hypothetical protein ACHAWF_003615 [Thalassiosira exigua]
MPHPSRTTKFNVAERAVASDRPTPTPSKILWVARTERRAVERSWTLSRNA